MRQKYDVVVVGGGFSGAAAAVAAARENASVLLVEQYGFLGGAAGNSQVNPFMPYRRFCEETGGQEEVNRGLFLEILRRLDEIGGLHENHKTFNEEMLKIVLDRLMVEYGVDVLFHTRLTGVKTEQGRIVEITVVNKSGMQSFAADYFIDATGDADLAALAGCPYHLGREEDQLCQPMTLCFRVGNVDLQKFNIEANRDEVSALYRKLQKEGKIKNPREDVLMFDHVCNGVIHFNSTRIVKRNPVDAADVSIAEMQAREQMLELYTFMKENVPGFENSTLLMSAPQIGVRESRMIDGEYVITADDLLSCKKFDDAIACGVYGVDIHSPDGSGTVRKHIPRGEYYTIPYRALIPKNRNNLLVAGRCISSTHEAQSAYRVMPIVCCIGEAAGIAAGLAARKHIRPAEVPVKELQEKIGAYGGMYR